MAAAILHDDFFLDSEERQKRTPHCAFCQLIRTWEWLRAAEVSRGQDRHRVGPDAADGRNGGVERIVWETLLEMERFDYRAVELDQRAITVVPDLAKAFERTHFNVHRKILRVLCS